MEAVLRHARLALPVSQDVAKATAVQERAVAAQKKETVALADALLDI